MKKLLLLFFLVVTGLSSYAQQTVHVKNNSPCDILLRVENRQICSKGGNFQSVTVPAGATIPVNTTNPGTTEIIGIHIMTSNAIFTSPSANCLICPSFIIGPPTGSWIATSNCTSSILNYYYEWYCENPGVSSFLLISI